MRIERVELFLDKNYLIGNLRFAHRERNKLVSVAVYARIYIPQLVHSRRVLCESRVIFLVFFGYLRVDIRYDRRQCVLARRRGFVSVYVKIYFVMFEPLFEFEREPRFFRLFGKRFEPRQVDLHSVVDTAQIFARALIFVFRRVLAILVLGDSRGLLEYEPAVLGLGIDYFHSLVLSDNGVALGGKPRVAQHFRNIAQKATTAVAVIFAFARTEKLTRDNDLLVLVRREKRPVFVVERERNLGIRLRGTLFCAREYYVLHVCATQKLGRLLAQNPTHGVRNIALAAAVRSDYCGYTVAEHDIRLVGKRFKP